MAIIDTERNVVVVQIVYDGPSLSGKTTSLTTLAKLLGDSTKIYVPSKMTGTGYYSQWIEYTGGFFKGYRISCQIISISGRPSLDDPAYCYLLQTADAVVWVLDASANPEITLNYFKDLQPVLSRPEENTIKVIVQANKHDLSTALPVTQLRKIFQDYPQVKIVESIATADKGVRETFVLAVRLAIERADALLTKDLLPYGKPKITCEADLHHKLQEILMEAGVAEKTTLTSEEIVQAPERANELVIAPVAITESFAETIIPEDNCPIITQQTDRVAKVSHTSAEPSLLFFDKHTATKLIWPPFQGRHIVTEILTYPLDISLKSGGWWSIHAHTQWRCFSKVEWQYTQVDQAQQAFRSQISLCLECGPMLADQRCVAVAQHDTESTWRSWQITPCLPTLLEHLTNTLQQDPPAQQALETFRCAIRYTDALQQSTHYSFGLFLHLENLGVNEHGQVIYVGPIDTPGVTRPPALDPATLPDMVQQEFAEQIAKLLPLAKTQKIIQEFRDIDGFEQQYLLDMLIEIFSN